MAISEGSLCHLSSVVSCCLEAAVGLHLEQQMKLYLKQIDTRCCITQTLASQKQTARHAQVFPQFKMNTKWSKTSIPGVSHPIIIYDIKKYLLSECKEINQFLSPKSSSTCLKSSIMNTWKRSVAGNTIQIRIS